MVLQSDGKMLVCDCSSRRGYSVVCQCHDPQAAQSAQKMARRPRAEVFRQGETPPTVTGGNYCTFPSTKSYATLPIEWRESGYDTPTHGRPEGIALRSGEILEGAASPAPPLECAFADAEAAVPADLSNEPQVGPLCRGSSSQHPAVQAICDYLYHKKPQGDTKPLFLGRVRLMLSRK